MSCNRMGYIKKTIYITTYANVSAYYHINHPQIFLVFLRFTLSGFKSFSNLYNNIPI